MFTLPGFLLPGSVPGFLPAWYYKKSSPQELVSDFSSWMYEFPMAAITNNYQPSDFKQHKFILLQFQRSEVHDESYKA